MIREIFFTIRYTLQYFFFIYQKRGKSKQLCINELNIHSMNCYLIPWKCECVGVHLCALFTVRYSLIARDRLIIICKYIAGKFVGELEGRDAARSLLFYKLRRGPHAAHRRWIYTGHNSNSFTLRGTKRTPFSHRFRFSSFRGKS